MRLYIPTLDNIVSKLYKPELSKFAKKPQDNM